MSSHSIQEERKQLISDIFDMFDKNEDGTIQANELHSVLESLGRNSNEDDVKAIFELIDVDQDGKVSYAEFAEIWKFQ